MLPAARGTTLYGVDPGHRELARKLAAMEKELKDRLDVHEAASNLYKACPIEFLFRKAWEALTRN